MAWKLEKRRGWGRNSISKYLFHISWALEVKCMIFWKAALHAIFRWCVTSIHRQSKYCNILLIVYFHTVSHQIHILVFILYFFVFSKKSIDIRHLTPDVSIPFAEKECLQTFYFPDTDLSGEVFYTDHNKKCLASTWKQSFDKYLQSVFAHLQYFLESRLTFYFMLRFSKSKVHLLCNEHLKLNIYLNTITELGTPFRNRNFYCY